MSVDLKMPVLIVDGYATMLRIVKNLLKQIGFENVAPEVFRLTALDTVHQGFLPLQFQWDL